MDLKERAATAILGSFVAFGTACGGGDSVDPCTLRCEKKQDCPDAPAYEGCISECREDTADAVASGCGVEFNTTVLCAAAEDACSTQMPPACEQATLQLMVCGFKAWCEKNPDNCNQG